eukprot:765767-Hanusia_phi.AAC.19
MEERKEMEGRAEKRVQKLKQVRCGAAEARAASCAGGGWRLEEGAEALCLCRKMISSERKESRCLGCCVSLTARRTKIRGSTSRRGERRDGWRSEDWEGEERCILDHDVQVCRAALLAGRKSRVWGHATDSKAAEEMRRERGSRS